MGTRGRARASAGPLQQEHACASQELLRGRLSECGERAGDKAKSVFGVMINQAGLCRLMSRLWLYSGEERTPLGESEQKSDMNSLSLPRIVWASVQKQMEGDKCAPLEKIAG